ncbi:MAG TPA: DUF2844 domain-containing protein [Aggregatilineales bacterium]|nr:DUF2844 domain-containing protein [Aggregatilineales bacterium]
MNRIGLSAAILITLLGGCSNASAALGGDVASVESDRLAAKASSQVADHGGYAVYELRSSPEASIKEYVAEGAVFAVSWEGPALPNLRQLLGSYFETYKTAAQAERTSHRSLVVRTPDLVVESSGRMGAFFGRAYLPRSFPAGVTVDDVQ